MFFSLSTKQLAKDVAVRGHTLRKGQIVTFVYEEMQAQHGTNFPHGFGPRACPGAAIGTKIIASLVAATVLRYRLRRTEPPPTMGTRLKGAWYSCLGAFSTSTLATALKPCHVTMEPRLRD